MNAPMHPADEQLAALAGGDPEVAADAALREHVAACERCSPIVDELSVLRLALAELPDLAPHRPIQLIPPAAEPKRSGALGWLRSFAAPAMVAGAGMILAGAVGLYGSGFGAASGQAPELFTDVAGELSAESTEGVPADRMADSPETDDGQLTPQSGGDGTDEESVLSLLTFEPPNWWLILLTAGAALLVLGLVFRFSIRPRAG